MKSFWRRSAVTMGKMRFFVCAALLLFWGASVTGSCSSSSRFSWFLRNRERFTTTFRRRRASFSSVKGGGGERGLKRDAHTRFSRPPQRSVCFNSLCAESETTRTATDGWDERAFINHHLDCCCSFQTTLLRSHLHFRHFHPVFPLFPRLLLLFLSF